MPHIRSKLTVKSIKSLPTGTYGDGGGLSLRKTSDRTGQWLYRFRLHGRQRQMGLGSFSKVSLSQARKLRDEMQSLVMNGKDPVLERKHARKAASAGLVTLTSVAEDAFRSRQAELKEDGKAGRWFSPLRRYVLPVLGDRPIVEIDQMDVRDALAPIWHDKADTAKKALNRLNIVIQHAAALGLDVNVQATQKARALLGKQRHRPQNIPAMPWQDVPAFYASLDQCTPVQLALRLLILNPGPRSKPIRFLRLNDIDGDVWIVPGELMKGIKGKIDDWRTPLSPESTRVIELASRFERNGNLFPNVSGRGVISDASMSRLMERRGLAFRPHGFRSSFRTWAAENDKRQDIAELCLAHKIHGAIEASYLRTDFLDARRNLMNAWAQFITSSD